MYALIWLADYMKPLHSTGARNFGDGYMYNLYSEPGVIRIFMALKAATR